MTAADIASFSCYKWFSGSGDVTLVSDEGYDKINMLNNDPIHRCKKELEYRIVRFFHISVQT